MKGTMWELCADTGGTFTDVIGRAPDGGWHRAKVLSHGCLRAKVKAVESPYVLVLDVTWQLPRDFFAGFQIVSAQDKNHVGDRGAAMVVGSVCEGEVKVILDRKSEIKVDELVELKNGESAPTLGVRFITRTPGRLKLPEHSLRLATTRGTNALLERKTSPTVFFVTEGFRDLLVIGDQRRPDLFALDIKKSQPIPIRTIEVSGRLTAQGEELEPMVITAEFEAQVSEALEAGVRTAAICLLHSHVNPDHEIQLAELLKRLGFSYVVRSSAAAPYIRMLPRAQTTVVDACLGPIMERYLDDVGTHLSGGRLLVMSSAGGLLPRPMYRPKDSLLSGPAGGVVGALSVGRRAGMSHVIAFDMGGTSTDVSRCAGVLRTNEKHTVGDAEIMSPALPIVTVAAGGGSVCGYDGKRLYVGPESAGASPGPACYGAGGPLTLTDVHLVLGRLRPDAFGIPVFPNEAEKALQAVSDQSGVEAETLARGFLEIANERMAEAIRRISIREGYDPADYALLSFGGAGGLHACALAEMLGMKTILVPADAGLLSAYGLGEASVERVITKQVLRSLDDVRPELGLLYVGMEGEGRESLVGEGFAQEAVRVVRREIRLRVKGQEADFGVDWQPEVDLVTSFVERYEETFGCKPSSGNLEVVSMLVAVAVETNREEQELFEANAGRHEARPEVGQTGWKDVICYRREQLNPGDTLWGPVLIVDSFSALVVEPGWRAVLGTYGTLRLDYRVEAQLVRDEIADAIVQRELFTRRFEGLVEEMGDQLRRTALSTNVKERMDYSCALLDSDGRLVANAPHIPVHLGAMGICVRTVAGTLDLQEGDTAVTNHPGFGGSHLPDVTVITPVFDDVGIRIGYVANRAHHAEIGGKYPGSMPPDATRLVEEGVVIPPLKLIENGSGCYDRVEALLRSGPYPSRSPQENLADLRAQVAANLRGADALKELVRQYGRERVAGQMADLMSHARQLAERALGAKVVKESRAEQRLDDGTKICVTVRPEGGGGVVVDFAGTSPLHPANFNAAPAIVHSALVYVMRLLVNEEIPLNDGLLDKIRLQLPPCFLNPEFGRSPEDCPPVSASNVETSQRLVDALFLALGLGACSQGTMNNLIFGNGECGYYETICGGAGAGPSHSGQSAVHTHMTNTAITDPEILEHRYPVRLRRFAVRTGSGGRGEYSGGDGVVRELEFLAPLTVSLLTQRRTSGPEGAMGGGSGKPGRQVLFLNRNMIGQELASSAKVEVSAGDRLVLETPGGGGWGKA